MIGQCPVLLLSDTASITGAMSAMDCQIEQAVETGYNRLFALDGTFAEVLTAILTIYIALIAYSFLTGRTKLTVSMLSPRLAALVLVLAFVSFWPAYHTLFYSLFMHGPDQVAAAILDQKGSATLHFTSHLDQLIPGFSDIGQALQSQNAAGNAAGGTAAAASAHVASRVNTTAIGNSTTLLSGGTLAPTLFWAAGGILLLATLGVLILTRLVLYFLLILGPVFIVLGLFGQTRGLFNGWLRALCVFAIAPMLTVLAGNVALSLFTPLIAYIGESATELNAISETSDTLRPVITLFIGALIYAALIFVLMRVIASIVHDWQAVRADPGSPPQPAASAPPARAALIQNGVSLQRRGEMQLTSTATTARADTAAARAMEISLPAPAASHTSSRVRGLGQRFRNVPKADGGKAQ